MGVSVLGIKHCTPFDPVSHHQPSQISNIIFNQIKTYLFAVCQKYNEITMSMTRITCPSPANMHRTLAGPNPRATGKVDIILNMSLHYIEYPLKITIMFQ